MTLTRKTPLKRGGRLKPVNRERRAAAFARNFGQRGALVRAMPCLLAGPGCEGQVQAAHAQARGMGGAKGDRFSLVPLCAGHHRRQENGTKTFEAVHGLDLRAEAARIAADLTARGVP